MEKMKVKIKDLSPNPFRNMDNYPLNPAKLESLKRSMLQTGFWDNILARQVNGKIQIAYGHHRLNVLNDIFDSDFEVEVPIKDLSDEIMLKIMANENMDDWHSSVAVIDETVRAVRRFLGFPGNETTIDTQILTLSRFLGWPETRVKNALARINAVEKGEVDKQSVESIPSQKAATAFAAKAKKMKLSTKQQRMVSSRLAKSGDLSAKSVDKAIREEVSPKQPKEREKGVREERMKNFDQFLALITADILSVKRKIQTLPKLKSEIIDFTYNSMENRLDLFLALKSISESALSLMADLEEESKSKVKTKDV